MDKENKKNEYITQANLDKQLGEQANVIISAVDNILEKRLGKMELKTESKFEALRFRFDETDSKLDKIESRLIKKINNVQTSIDGYVKAQEDFKEEFVIMKEENRQIKNIIKEKLNLEVSAV